MTIRYRASQDDVVDHVIYRVFNGQAPPGTVELVFRENKGLADFGPFLPDGTVFTIPSILPRARTTQAATLWPGGGGLPGIT